MVWPVPRVPWVPMVPPVPWVLMVPPVPMVPAGSKEPWEPKELEELEKSLVIANDIWRYNAVCTKGFTL